MRKSIITAFVVLLTMPSLHGSAQVLQIDTCKTTHPAFALYMYIYHHPQKYDGLFLHSTLDTVRRWAKNRKGQKMVQYADMYEVYYTAKIIELSSPQRQAFT